MAMNKVTRAERLLDRIVQSGRLTSKGRDWLIAAVDPMHDTQLPDLQGWPDIADQPSVVRCVKKTVTLHAPSGLAEGDTWTAMMMTLPVLNQRTVHVADNVCDVYKYVSDTDRMPIGPLVIKTFPSTITDWSIEGTLMMGVNNIEVIALDNEYAQGNGRLVSMGFEVVNTTAEIYKQGTVHTFRVPQQQETYPTLKVSRPTSVAGLYVSDAFTGRQIQSWPANEQAVTLMPGTRTWKAADGNYSVVPFISAENPITPAEFVQPVLCDEFTRGELVFQTSMNTDTMIPYPVTPAFAPECVNTFLANKWAPVHSTGAVYLGLSKPTVLTVTVNMYYEYFPSAADSSLVTLAKPSASYDPLALEMYSEAISTMPVSVPASMNGFGDWFAGLVSKWAVPIGGALTPLFGPAAAGVGLAAKGIADSYLTAQAPMTKPRFKQPALPAPRPPPVAPRRTTSLQPKAPPRNTSKPKVRAGKLTKAEKKRLRAAGVEIV